VITCDAQQQRSVDGRLDHWGLCQMPISGFPDATTTGVPAGVILKPSGDLVINTPGVVIEGLDIRGMVTINADNVTLKNCKITSGAWAVVNITSGSTGVVIENCEINGLNAEGVRGISGQGTFLRNNIHNTEDGIYLTGSNTLIQDNYIHDLQSNWSGPHYDGIATDGGVSNIVIRHNTVINSHGQTSALMLSNYFGSVSNVIVDNNWLEGGGYTVYSDGQFSGGTISGVSFTNNYLVKGAYGYSSIRNNSPVWEGNIQYVGQPTSPPSVLPAPTIESFAGDSGVVGDHVTSDKTVTLTGKAEASSTVKVFDDTKQIGTVSTNSNGAWTFTSSALTDGAHKFTAIATKSGVTSTASTALSVTIDTVAPVAPTIVISTSAAELANTHVAQLTGTAEANATVKVFDGSTQIGTAAVNGSGVWIFTTPALANGGHNLTAKAMDAAGNTSSASAVVAVNVSPSSSAPNAPTIVSFSDDSGVVGDGVTNDNTLTLTGTAAPHETIKIYDGTKQVGTATTGDDASWSYIMSVLSDAKHTLTAVATNAAGQTSKASAALEVIVDTIAPSAPTITSASDGGQLNLRAGAASTEDGNGVNLVGTAEAKSSVEIFDGSRKIGATTAGADGSWNFDATALSAGPHVLTARATDVAGNVSKNSAVFDVDIPSSAPNPPAAPSITSFSKDSGKVGDFITNDNTLTLKGMAAANSAVAVYEGAKKIGTATSDDSGTWSFVTAALADGAHNLTARVTDGSGQTGPASSVLSVTIDTHAPNAPTLGVFSSDGKAVAGTTMADAFVLKGMAEANSTINIFDSGRDLGSTKTKADGTWTFDTGHLTDGSHSFTSSAVDAAGNVSALSAKKSIAVLDPPDANLSVTDVHHGWHNSVVIKGTADAYSQIKIYDGSKSIGTVTSDGDGTWTLSAHSSSHAVHTFSAKQLDQAGQVVESSGNAIVGTCGNNFLKGTSADDLFIGRGHSDTFVFAPNFGNDVIKDFKASGWGHDVVQFSKSVFDNFADVLAHATQSGRDVVIATDHSDSLTLKNTKLSSLDKSDFHFV
jgi:parallel beta-helix repeat protein